MRLHILVFPLLSPTFCSPPPSPTPGNIQGLFSIFRALFPYLFKVSNTPVCQQVNGMGQRQTVLHSEVDLTKRLLKVKTSWGGWHWGFQGHCSAGGPWLISRECLVICSLPHTSNQDTKHSSTGPRCPPPLWQPWLLLTHGRGWQTLMAYLMHIYVVRY